MTRILQPTPLRGGLRKAAALLVFDGDPLPGVAFRTGWLVGPGCLFAREDSLIVLIAIKTPRVLSVVLSIGRVVRGSRGLSGTGVGVVRKRFPVADSVGRSALVRV